ncbi:MAG: hypothetical protein CMP23_03520 [Rickettsiales bacterium]|nr:hypothetical protein [Rickettsiales bacterium]|tara:strand:+ start:710 stop:2647 length:1938 start_codon:yes stop_codon:yes gene_type:complete
MIQQHRLRDWIFTGSGFVLGLGLWLLIARTLTWANPVDTAASAAELGLNSLTLRAGYDKGQELKLLWLGCLLTSLGMLLGRWLALRQPIGPRPTTGLEGITTKHSEQAHRLHGRLAWSLILLTSLATALRPNAVFGVSPWGNFGLLAEEGVYLGAIQALREGRKLYAELHFPYGPLLLQPLRAWLALFGDHIASARAYVMCLHGLGVLTMALCVRALLGRTTSALWSAAGAALALALLAPSSLPNLNSVLLRPMLGFLPVAVLLAALRWQKRAAAVPRRALSPFHLAGCLTALALLCSVDVGAAAIASMTTILLLSRPGIPAITETAVGSAAVLAIGLLPLVPDGSLIALWEQNLQTLKLSALGYQAIPYPDALKIFIDSDGRRGGWPQQGLTAAQLVWSTLPPLLCWLALGLGASQKLRPGPRGSTLSLLGVSIASLTLLHAAFGRSDLYHLWFYGAAPSILLLVLLAAGSWAGLPRRLRGLSPTLAGITLAGILYCNPMAEVQVQGDELQQAAIELNHPRSGGIRAGRESVAQIEAILNFVEQLPADQGLWFYPSEAMLYYLSDRPLPSSFLWAIDGPDNALQQRAIKELEESRPQWLVRNQIGFVIDGIQEEQLLPQIHAYIEAHYHHFDTLPGTTIMRRKP